MMIRPKVSRDRQPGQRDTLLRVCPCPSRFDCLRDNMGRVPDMSRSVPQRPAYKIFKINYLLEISPDREGVFSPPSSANLTVCGFDTRTPAGHVQNRAPKRPFFAPACRNVAKVAGVQREITKTTDREKAASLRGYSVGGCPLTATGKIISLQGRR